MWISLDSAENLAEEAVDCALKRGADYADVRVQFEESTGFMVGKGMVEEGNSTSLGGVGLRVIVDGAWGFCSMDNAVSESSLGEVALRAIKLASHSAKGVTSPVNMAPARSVRARVIRNEKPFDSVKDLDFEDVLGPARDCDHLASSTGSEILDFSLSFSIGGFIETYASSEGSRITQAYSGYLGSLCVIVADAGTIEYYPYDFGGLGDYHEFLNQRLPSLTKRIAQKARQLGKSRTLHEMNVFKTVVMDPGFTALWVHEAIGHPLEADRVLGGKGDPSTTPWTSATLTKRVAPTFFSVVDDPSIETPAWHKYDGEGIEAKRKLLISDGVITECIHNRETAKAFQVEPNGGARSPSYRFTPMPRMSNTYIESGEWSAEEIIEDVREGIYVVGGVTPVVDTRAYEWKISAKEAYVLAKGEISGMLRGVVVSEVTPDFLISIDALAKDLEITLTPDCAKGNPVQTLPVGNGGPTMRGKAYVSGVA